MDDYFEKINFHLRLLAHELPMGLSRAVVTLNLSERSTDDLLNIFQEVHNAGDMDKKNFELNIKIVTGVTSEDEISFIITNFLSESRFTDVCEMWRQYQ